MFKDIPLIDSLLNIKVYGVVIVVILSFIVYRIIKSVTGRIFKVNNNGFELKRKQTIKILIENIFKYLIIIIAALIILEIYGVDTMSLVAGLGVVGVVVGLAMQDTLKDIIAGITIILENYFIVGDYVKYGSFSGEVISFGLKSTKLKNLNGEVLIIANRNISEIINISQKEADIIIDIDIAYEEKITKVEKCISGILEEIKEIPDVKSKFVEYQGIDKLDDSSVKYRIKITCDQDHQWRIKRQSLRIIKIHLDKNKIKIPYPQMEVHNVKTN